MHKAAIILAIAGAALLGYAVFVRIQERWFQLQSQRRISIEAHVAPITPKSHPYTSETQPHPEIGSVIGTLAIPRIGLSVAVVEGASGSQLRVAAGHIPGTAFPGENSNAAFAAHRDTHFRPLRSVRLDDEIEMIAMNRSYRYRVVFTKIVEPQDVSVLYPADRETLTLVTCYPFRYVGPAPRRFIVRAECTNCGK